MEIVELEVQLNSTQYSHEKHQRSSGLHLSSIIKNMEEEVFNVERPDMEDNALEAYRIGGFLFERALYDIILQDSTIHRIGEIQCDGIIMTPDAIDLGRDRGIESKCTWRSMKHDVTDVTGEFSSWWIQIMGYAKGLGILSWDLWVMFINGDYGKHRRPAIRHWAIDLDREEVEANWKMILSHRDWMVSRGDT